MRHTVPLCRGFIPGYVGGVFPVLERSGSRNAICAADFLNSGKGRHGSSAQTEAKSQGQARRACLRSPCFTFGEGCASRLSVFCGGGWVRTGERKRPSEALGSGREPSTPQLTEAKRARPYAKNKVAIALFVRYLVNKCFTDRICFLVMLRFKLSEAALELRRRMRQALSEATRARISARVPSKKASQPQADKGGGRRASKGIAF